MADDDYKRRLTAILSADVVGYSRLMGEDAFATVGTLKSHRQRITEKIEAFDGRLMDSPGDNVLAEFSSIVDAVSCAVQIQEALEEQNKDLPEIRRMAFRIGVNLGDVVQDGHRIHGDWVNIAARIDGLAVPGGVSISGTAFDSVRNKLGYGYQYSGEQMEKNIAQPVRVYKVLTEPEEAGKVIGEKRFFGRMSCRVAIVAILVLAIVAVGLISYNIYHFRSGSIAPASIEKMAYPLPDEPSITVLPFDNLSGDPEQDVVGDGFTDQLITILTRVPRLFVIARHSSFSFKGKAVTVRQVAEELGVRYVLEGDLRMSKGTIHINARLIDAVTGQHLWAQRYDRPLIDLFALQDEITLKTLSAVGIEVGDGDRGRILSKGTRNVDAYLKVMHGYQYWYRLGRETNLQARKLAEEAIALDLQFPDAYVLRGATHHIEPFLGATTSPRKSWEAAIRSYQRALAMDPSHPVANSALAFVYGCRKQYEKASTQARRAIEINPGRNLSYLGFVFIFTGRYEEALHAFKRSIRRDPKGPPFYFIALGHAYRGLKQYDDAIAAYRRALDRHPNYPPAYAFLAATYYLAGREDEARAAATEVLRIHPEFSLHKFAKVLPYRDKDYLNSAIEAMRSAGLKQASQEAVPLWMYRLDTFRLNPSSNSSPGPDLSP